MQINEEFTCMIKKSCDNIITYHLQSPDSPVMNMKSQLFAHKSPMSMDTPKLMSK